MKKVIIVILSIIFVTILCIISKKENNINENLYTFYIENQKVNEIRSNEYVLEKAICDNGATLTWNGGLKQAKISGSKTSKTKCDLYFIKNPSKEYFENLQKERPTELAYDGKETLGEEVGTDDNNLRFIGSSPKNYILFNNETWRIIGVMNNIEDETGDIGSHLKIIRNSSIGLYSWDSSAVNSGKGVNEWSEADIQKVLNENYYKKETGGVCYNGTYEKVVECPKWEEIGLNDNSRAMVSKVKWNLGKINHDNMKVKNIYEAERSTNKVCDSIASCSDYVLRTTLWTGYVGLIYPSDFGYAKGGTNRSDCFKESMNNWSENTSFSSNDWLGSRRNSFYTISPIYDESNVSISGWNGSLSYAASAASNDIYPVVYLNSNIKIEEDASEDYGSSTNPFRLSVT